MRTAELESELVLRRARVVARQETVDSKAIACMKDTLAGLEGKCPSCWALGCAYDHRLPQCPWLAHSKYQDLRRLVKYEPHSCCFRCSAPGNWCIDYINRHIPGTQQDSIFPICIIAFGHSTLSRSGLESNRANRAEGPLGLGSVACMLGSACSVA